VRKGKRKVRKKKCSAGRDRTESGSGPAFAGKQANKNFRVFKNRIFPKNPVFLKNLYPKIYGTLLIGLSNKFFDI